MGQLGNLVVMVAITAVVGVALFLLLRQKGEDDPLYAATPHSNTMVAK